MALLIFGGAKGALRRKTDAEVHSRMAAEANLRAMLSDSRAARGFRSTGQLEKSIAADRATTERLLLAIGARKSNDAEEWTLRPQGTA